MKVLVQHCIGRYGRTQLIQGKLLSIGPWGDVDVEPDTPMRDRRPGIPAGTCLYPGFTLDASLGENVLRGFSVWTDFEHGHEKFIEVLEEVGSQTKAS